jgi:hypothetical protein
MNGRARRTQPAKAGCSRPRRRPLLCVARGFSLRALHRRANNAEPHTILLATQTKSLAPHQISSAKHTRSLAEHATSLAGHAISSAGHCIARARHYIATAGHAISLAGHHIVLAGHARSLAGQVKAVEGRATTRQTCCTTPAQNTIVVMRCHWDTTSTWFIIYHQQRCFHDPHTHRWDNRSHTPATTRTIPHCGAATHGSSCNR